MLLAEDWAAEYRQCPVWSEPWQQVKEAQRSGRWPRGYRIAAGRMLKGGLWCVPTALAGAVLRAHHAAAGHVGGQRLWKEALRHFHFADNEKAYTMAMRTQAQCSTCQACEHPHQPLRLKVTPTPIPPHVMTSVAIDLFVMPEVEDDGQKWNVFAACVDRHSG